MLRIERRGSTRVNGATWAKPAETSAEPVTAPPRLPGRRNPKWIALGVIAICLGALLSSVIYSRVAAESSVLIMTKTVYRGSVIMADDLTAATISGTGAGNAVPAEQLEELIGGTAIYDLVSGSVVPAGAIGELIIPAEGRTVVGVRLIEGRAPTGLLHPGSPLRLIALPPDGAEPDYRDEHTGVAYPAKVVDTVDGSDGMSTLINIDVAADQAAAVAALAAKDRLAVVRDAEGGG